MEPPTTVEDGVKFEVKLKPIILSSYAAYGGYPHEASAHLTITYAFQRAFRRARRAARPWPSSSLRFSARRKITTAPKKKKNLR